MTSMTFEAAGQADDSTAVEELLKRCAKRDSGAFEELYKKTSSQLMACLQAILRRRDLAEEALQDVYVRIWQRAGQFDGYRGRPMAWLMSIARYHAIDLVRARKPVVDLDQEQVTNIPDPTAEERVDARESERTRVTLERCLGQLTEPQRECLQLAYIEGYSHEQISSSTEHPLGTVKSWMRRGLQSLKRCMES